MTCAEQLKGRAPQLIAEVTMYPPERGGRRSLAFPGWGCPCCLSKDTPIVARDGWPLLGDEPLAPGNRRRLGFVFLSPESAAIFKAAGSFFLWEGGFVGEAIVVIDEWTRGQKQDAA